MSEVCSKVLSMDSDPDEWFDEGDMPPVDIPLSVLMAAAAEQPDELDDVLDLTQTMMQFVAQRYSAIDGMRRRAVDEATAFSVDLASVAFRSVRLELAAALRVSEYVAEAMLVHAEALVHRYPEVWHSLHAGRIDDDKSHVLVAGLDEIGAEAAALLLPEALDAAENLQIGPFRRMLRRLIETHRASTLEERHEQALEQRRVVLETLGDGMAWLGAHIPAVEAQAIHQRLTAMGKAITAAEGEERTLDQVRSEIADELRAEKQRTALTELAANIESRVNSGESLSDIAKGLKLEVKTTEPLLASGAVFNGARGERAPDIVMPLVATAFQMREGKPQIAEVRPGEAFALFEASEITGSATPPLKEIRNEVVDGWKLAEGAKEAKKAADRILKRVREGSSLAEAVRAEKKPLPGVQPVNVSREELMQQQGSPPLALMFAMSANSAKRLAASGDAGYYLVSLDKITAGKVEKDDPLIKQAATGYGNILSRELGDQLRIAIRKEVDFVFRKVDCPFDVHPQLQHVLINPHDRVRKFPCKRTRRRSCRLLACTVDKVDDRFCLRQIHSLIQKGALGKFPRSCKAYALAHRKS